MQLNIIGNENRERQNWRLVNSSGMIVWEKVRTFTVEAGKIILVVSIILWFLASNGPTSFDNAQKYQFLHFGW